MINPKNFMIVSSLIVVISLLLATMTDYRESYHNLQEDIAELNSKLLEKETSYDRLDSELLDTEEKLKEIEEHNQELQEQKEFLEERLEIIDDLLFWQKDTYDNATDKYSMNENVKSPSGFTAKMFERAWENLDEPGMEGTGEGFVRAEKETGINALVLASIAAHESNFGKSNIAKHKNNYFGFTAYDDSPFESARDFITVDEGTVQVAHYLRNNYLNRNGRYYQGEDLQSINVNYATDENWANAISNIMGLIAENAINEQQLNTMKEITQK